MMKKQYLPQFQFKKDEGTNSWGNAMMYTTSKSRYAKTEAEAKAALALVKKQFNKGARDERFNAGGLGGTFVIDEETAKSMQIVNTRIKVREVSDWEII